MDRGVNFPVRFIGTLKNFPHQITDLGKFIAGLDVFGDLEARGASLDDDGIVGDALARTGVYAFRDKGLTIDAALAQERLKPASSRGFQTAARDLRRFYELLGFVSAGRLTGLGRATLAAGTDVASTAVKDAWRSALVGLDLEGSHPYRILLRLVPELAGVRTRNLALCLEAQDDSDDEFHRVLGLARIGDSDAVQRALGIGEFGWANAQKILPSLALQLGDVVQDSERHIVGAAHPLATSSVPAPTTVAPTTPRSPVARPRSAPRSVHRTVTASAIATATAEEEGDTAPIISDVTAAVGLRLERRRRHNELVQLLARRAEEKGFELKEDPYDCLATTPDGATSLLIEAKTLAENPDPGDERDQVRDALGQLLYYEFMDVPAGAVGVIKVAAFDRRPSDAHIWLLNHWGIAVIWRRDLGFEGDSVALRVPALALVLS